MSVRDTSREAYAYVVYHGITAAQQQTIIRTLCKAGEALTRAEIAHLSSIRIPSVCGAVNHLVKVHKLMELAPRKCRVTGYNAHPVTLVRNVSPQPVDERDAQAQAPDHQLPLWGGDPVVPPRRMDS